MPTALIGNIALAKGLSKTEIDNLWRQAREIAKKEYEVDEGDVDFWKLSMGVFKRMLGCKKGEEPECLVSSESLVEKNLKKRECYDRFIE